MFTSAALASAVLFCSLSTFLVGLGIGVLIERKGWNKLIREGRLPKPTARRSVCNNNSIHF